MEETEDKKLVVEENENVNLTYNLPTSQKIILTSINSSPKFVDNANGLDKSRISKKRRFNSTHARYKNVINKMDKKDSSLAEMRKWSQGIKMFLNSLFYSYHFPNYIYADL